MEITAKNMMIIIGVFISVIFFLFLLYATEMIQNSARDATAVTAAGSLIFMKRDIKKTVGKKKKGIISLLAIMIVAFVILVVLVSFFILYKPDIIKSATNFFFGLI